MYFAPTKEWKQTWVDNQGSYIDLTGGLQPNGDFVLTTLPRPQRACEPHGLHGHKAGQLHLALAGIY